jgi:transposase-like protein
MKYDENFKQNALSAMENRNGKTVRDVAKDLGIQQSQLYAWKAAKVGVTKKAVKAKPKAKAPDAWTAASERIALRDEIAKLRAENAGLMNLREENADLTKVIVKLVYKGMFG